MVIPRPRTEFRGIDASLFTPLRVTIGPYHWRPAGEEQCPRDNEKKEAANEICNLIGETRSTELRTELNMLESNARACYPDGVPEMQPEEFSTMLLHDGCYVLRFLEPYEEITPIVYATAAEGNMVMRDILFLLENQIPWFVLWRMHCCIMGLDPNRKNSCANEQLATRVRGLLQLLCYTSCRRQLPRPLSYDEPSHLLHLVHHYLAPRKEECRLNIVGLQGAAQQDPNARRVGRWRRATEYRYAFVQLKPHKLEAGKVDSILDVHLEGRTLWIPPLRIDGHLWTILRNLMALEEHMSWKPVTAYCIFMSQLASKVEDVDFLRCAGILNHFDANDDEVVQCFAKLCQQVVYEIDDDQVNYLNETWHQLQERFDNGWYNFIGSFLKVHVRYSVRFFAFVGAVIVILLQLAQLIVASVSLLEQIRSHGV